MITLLLMIAAVGFIAWIITAYIPMPEPFKIVIIVVAAIFVVLIVMRAFGIADIPLR
jgi:hypothetical protein